MWSDSQTNTIHEYILIMYRILKYIYYFYICFLINLLIYLFRHINTPPPFQWSWSE